MDPAALKFLLDEIGRKFDEADARFDRLFARLQQPARGSTSFPCNGDSGAVSTKALVTSTDPDAPLGWGADSIPTHAGEGPLEPAHGDVAVGGLDVVGAVPVPVDAATRRRTPTLGFAGNYSQPHDAQTSAVEEAMAADAGDPARLDQLSPLDPYAEDDTTKQIDPAARKEFASLGNVDLRVHSADGDDSGFSYAAADHGTNGGSGPTLIPVACRALSLVGATTPPQAYESIVTGPRLQELESPPTDDLMRAFDAHLLPAGGDGTLTTVSTSTSTLLRTPAPTAPWEEVILSRSSPLRCSTKCPSQALQNIVKPNPPRMNESTGAARPNPQGSFHYGSINGSQVYKLRNEPPVIINGKKRVTLSALVWGIKSLDKMVGYILPKPPWLAFDPGKLFRVDYSSSSTSASLQYALQFSLDVQTMETVDTVVPDQTDTTEVQVFVAVSVAATQGLASVNTMKFQGTIQGVEVAILVDSGSSRSFVSADLASQLSGVVDMVTPASVQVADGGRPQCSRQLLGAKWMVQQCEFSTNFRVLDISAYDVIVGMDWLSSYSPMKIQWAQWWVIIPYQGSSVLLHGCSAILPLGSVVAVHLVEPVQSSFSELGWPEALVTLLSEFATVFAPPMKSDIQDMSTQFTIGSPFGGGWDAVMYKQPWPPPVHVVILGDFFPVRLTPWQLLDTDIYSFPGNKPESSASAFGFSTESTQCAYDFRGNTVSTILLMMQRCLYEQMTQYKSEEDCTRVVKCLPPAEAALHDLAVNLLADLAQEEQINKRSVCNIAMVCVPNMTQMADPLIAFPSFQTILMGSRFLRRSCNGVGVPMAYLMCSFSGQVPELVLKKRLNSVGQLQVLVQWSGLSPSLVTWEDFTVMHQAFPKAPAWGQAGFLPGGNVSTTEATGVTEDGRKEMLGGQATGASELRRGSRPRKRNVKLVEPEWVNA